MKILLLMIMSLGASVSLAVTVGAPRFEEFYTVKESTTSVQTPTYSLNPAETLAQIWDELPHQGELQSVLYSLLSFEHHKEAYGDVSEPYNRKKHFGGWIRDRRDNTCYNTRAKVLIRDSVEPVEFNNTGCSVTKGYWNDPYGGRDYDDSRDIQIDHFVPLKNAYISGAYKWNREKRCLYSNFLGNKFHLLPVYGKENTRKSDQTPEKYMPPNQTYRCQYLTQWLKVKFIWSLALTPPEKEAVEELVASNHCELGDLTMKAQELEQQRRFIADNMSLCQ